LGEHFAVLIRGAVATDFRKGEKSRDEITDLMAGGETKVDLEAKIVSCFGCSDAVRPLPPARDIFHFGSLHPGDLGLTFGMGLVVLVLLELMKPMLRPGN